MRVNDPNTAGLAAPASSRTPDIHKPDRADLARSGNADPNGDRVEFSATLGRLSNAISAESAQRQKHVQQVAAAYQSGKYRPDSRAISRAMISEAATPES